MQWTRPAASSLCSAYACLLALKLCCYLCSWANLPPLALQAGKAAPPSRQLPPSIPSHPHSRTPLNHAPTGAHTQRPPQCTDPCPLCRLCWQLGERELPAVLLSYYALLALGTHQQQVVRPEALSMDFWPTAANKVGLWGCSSAPLGCSRPPLGCSRAPLGCYRAPLGYSSNALGYSSIALGCSSSALGYSSALLGCSSVALVCSSVPVGGAGWLRG